MFGLCFVMYYMVSFLVLQSSSLLYFNCLPGVLWLFCVLWLFFAVKWVGLQYVIVVFLILLTYPLFEDDFVSHLGGPN